MERDRGRAVPRVAEAVFIFCRTLRERPDSEVALESTGNALPRYHSSDLIFVHLPTIVKTNAPDITCLLSITTLHKPHHAKTAQATLLRPVNIDNITLSCKAIPYSCNVAVLPLVSYPTPKQFGKVHRWEPPYLCSFRAHACLCTDQATPSHKSRHLEF
jgi:hypothetical protein